MNQPWIPNDYECPFCGFISYGEPAEVHYNDGRTMIVTPLRPATPGHKIVLPRKHVVDASADPEVLAETMRVAATYAAEHGSQYNLITSVGPDATQTVWHMHVHIIPRDEEDTLRMRWPWRPTNFAQLESAEAELIARRQELEAKQHEGADH